MTTASPRLGIGRRPIHPGRPCVRAMGGRYRRFHRCVLSRDRHMFRRMIKLPETAAVLASRAVP